MWRALVRKGRADLLGRPVEVAMLLVVIAVGAATLTIALTVQNATQRSFETFIEENHAGHAWLFSSRDRLVEIADRAYVEDAGEPVPAFDNATLVSSAEPRDLSVFGVAEAQPAVALGVMREGRWPATGDSREVVLDPGLARDAEVGVGDTVLVATPSGIYELTVVGLAIPTSRAPFPVWDYGRIFVSPESVALFNGGEPAYFAAGYRLEDPALVPQFLRGVAVTYGRSAPGARAWTEIRDSIAEENEEMFILLTSFGGFALVAAAFIIANSVTGQVQAQLRDVGLLKAIGATPRQVSALLTVEVVAVASAAAALGILGGNFAAPAFIGDIREQLGIAEPGSVSPLTWPLTFVGVVVLATVAALVPAIRAGRAPALSAIRTGSIARSGVSRLARLANWLHAPRVVSLSLKDLFARRLRAWLTIAAVGVAAAAVIAAGTMDAALSNAASNPAVIGVLPAELELDRLDLSADGEGSFVSDEEIEAALEANTDVRGWITRRRFSVTVSGERVTGMAIGGQTEIVPLALREGRMFEGRNEAVVGLGLARRFGINIGDRVLVSAQQPIGSTVVTVTGVYIDDENDGRVITISLEDLQRKAPGVDAGDYALALTDDADPELTREALVSALGGRVAVTNVDAEIEAAVGEVRDQVQPVLLALSAFLLALVAVNLLSTLTLSVRERTREIGVMRAVGFTPRQVVVSITTGAAVLSLIGAVLGAPAGWIFIRLVLEAPFSEQGYQPGEIVTLPSPLWALGMLAAVLLVAMIGSYLPARRAASIRVSDALRFE